MAANFKGVKMFDKVGGLKFEKYMAVVDAVQWEVDSRALEIAERATDLLKDHRVQGIAHIEVAKGKRFNHYVDSYVQLVDSNATNRASEDHNSALSIEFGRAGFLDDHGETWGEMEGLHILTTAAHLPKKEGQREKKVRRNRVSDRDKIGRFKKKPRRRR